MTPFRMTPGTTLVLALLALSACGSERTAAQGGSACDRYLGCLDEIVRSGGAAASAYSSTIDQARAQYGAGGTCDSSAQTRQQCDTGCTSALAATSQAFPSVSACSAAVANAAGPDAGGSNAGGGGTGPCKAYLSCVLATSPSGYAAALTIYGEEAACWDTPAQSTSCDAACGAALHDLVDVCSCSGSTCTAYHKLEAGKYAAVLTLQGADPSCPPWKADKLLDVSVWPGHAKFDMNVSAPAQGPFGSPLNMSLRGDLVYAKNAGTATWHSYFSGTDYTSPIKLTASNVFQSDIDWYQDGDCIYRAVFTRQ